MCRKDTDPPQLRPNSETFLGPLVAFRLGNDMRCIEYIVSN